MYSDKDTYDDKYRTSDPPPMSDALFGPAFDADGDPTAFTRQSPNGRLTEADPAPTRFGVDRGDNGAFVSRDRAPVPQTREEDGTLQSDPFAIGNTEPFGGDGL